MKNYIYRVISILILLAACKDAPKEKSTLSIIPSATTATKKNYSEKLADYWYQGKAEISSYDLQQARYGDIHPGEAVLVFVSEDFLTDKQVKNDNYTNKNSIPILKNNFLRKFTTGIYDYSIMTSVFTPANAKEFPQTSKVTISSQDWCGQSFMQINQQKNKYKVQLRSYFENEGDKDFTINNALLEDEIFNRIRMNPDALPTGKIQVIPSSTIVRLMHLEMQPMMVTVTKQTYEGTDFEGEDLVAYEIDYPTLKRKLTIVYQQKAPFIIEGWTDKYTALSRKQLTTTATRKKTILSPYWRQNGTKDVRLRKELELTTFE